MEVTRTTTEVDYIPLLKDNAVHVVAFAEEGLSFFQCYCQFALGLSIAQGVSYCNRINQHDETGTLFPKGNLTALPKRFFRNAEWDEEGFRKCLRDAFVANRDYCKTEHLIFQFCCVSLHHDALFTGIKGMAESEFSDSCIKTITVHFSK